MHVLIALGDERLVGLRSFACEFAEAGFHHVGLLELLDFIATDFLAAEHAGQNTGILIDR